MTQFKIAIGLGLVAALAVGCSSGTAPKNGVDAVASVPNTGPLVTTQQLQGDWKGLCGLSYSGTNTHEQFELTFSNVVIFNINGYADSSCTNALINTQLVGSYNVTGLDANVNGASDLTLTLNSAQITSQADSSTAALNAAATCGLTNWQTGVSQTIPLTAPCLQTYEFTATQLIAIQDQTLYFGNSDNTAINLETGYAFAGNPIPSGN